MVPVVSFISFSASGKTSLLEIIIPKLKKNGLRVAVIKHAAHGFQLDHSGKDSWRFNHAGSDIVVLSSPQKTAVIERSIQEPNPLQAIIDSIHHKVDIILVEGFKKANLPKIEVRATLDSPGLSCPEEDLIAIITGEPSPERAPRFNAEDVDALVKRLIEVATSSLPKKTF